MLSTNTVNTRELARNYKKVFEKVKRTGEPKIVMNNKKPEIAIVSIEDLESITSKQTMKKSHEGLRRLIGLLPSDNLPKDLSVNHDKYAWDE